MKILGLLLVLTMLSVVSFAHRGDVLAIENVKITETKTEYVYSFQIENIVEKDIKDVQIEFWINEKVILTKKYDLFSASPKFRDYAFSVNKSLLNIKSDNVQIEITQLFGKKNDWGGWDSPNESKQTNTLASEFYVEAPWRMKKTDGTGSDQSIPLHFFLHDADEVVGFTLKIDYINIKVKSASSNSFGPILTYNSLPTATLNAMFSSMSIANSGLGVKGFDLNSFTATSGRTFDFDKESDFFDEYVSVNDEFWYFTFNLPASELAGLDDVVDIEATISYANSLIPTDDVVRMRVFRSTEDIPSLPDYYRGDTHLHAMFTQNDAEVGLPMSGTKEAAKLIGLDWITSTDHTSDFDNYGSGNINTNWALLKAEAALLNGQDASMIFIPGQEVAVNNSAGKLVHMLAYPDYNNPMSLPFLGDGDGDVTSTTVTIDNVVAQLISANGFSYCSHPFATGDELSSLVNGGIWNLGDAGFPVNGNSFVETGGSIICNDMGQTSDVLDPSSGKLIKDAIRGSQIWNERVSVEVGGLSGDELDPWDVKNNGSAMSLTDTAGYDFHFKRFQQGQEVVNYINQMGLAMKNADPSLLNWKMYYSAGADAHGSFNSSNTNNTASAGNISNTAVGKLNTLVYCPTGMGPDGTNALKALYNGQSSISDGPIISMGISNDGANTVNEILMGADADIAVSASADYFLNINYATTQEFGDVTRLTFIVGAESGGELRKSMSIPAVNGTNALSYNLLDVMDSVFGIGNTPLNKYMYVRTELATFKDYSSNQNEFRTNYEIFHSISNPIWVKWSAPISVREEENNISIYPNPTSSMVNIALDANHKFTSMKVYNAMGQVVINQPVLANNIYLDLSHEAKGVYSLVLESDKESGLVRKIVRQ